jgi:hypothetical protein
MADKDCVGEGAGWGTVEGTRLRVLLLAAAERGEVARAIARALSRRHDPAVVDDHGLFSSFHAARAAKDVAPHLIHAVGGAKSTAVVALGIKAPYVLSIVKEDIDRRNLIETINQAAAVLLDSGALANELRARGVERDLYVLSPPEHADEDERFLGALEVVYGRVLAGSDVELELEPEAPVQSGGEKLVHIGRRKS